MYKSIAVWPNTVNVGNKDNSSEDKRQTEEQADGVCRMLRKYGFGGEGKIFHISTRVEPVEE